MNVKGDDMSVLGLQACIRCHQVAKKSVFATLMTITSKPSVCPGQGSSYIHNIMVYMSYILWYKAQ